MLVMTKLFEQAIEATRTLPPELQDEIARLMLAFGQDESDDELSPEEEASLAVSLAQADRGEFASDEEIKAIWAKHGL